MAGRIRGALVQVHLWIGIGLGLYVLMMSLTGSAVVARRELTLYWIPEAVPANGRERLSAAALRDIAQSLYPGYQITAFRENRRPLRPGPGRVSASNATSMARPVEFTFVRGESKQDRRFDPFTGRDMGDTFPPPYRVLLALVNLHDDLLSGRTGRFVNGLAAIATTVLVIAGLIIWWPVRGRRWRHSLWMAGDAPWRTQLRQLHNMLGFWPFLLLLLWVISGIYFAFPEPFEAAKDYFFPPDSPHAATGDLLLNWMARLHFGRFGGPGVRAAWILLGLAPAALFITGATMWWYRVLAPRLNSRLPRQPDRQARDSIVLPLRPGSS